MKRFWPKLLHQPAFFLLPSIDSSRHPKVARLRNIVINLYSMLRENAGESLNNSPNPQPQVFPTLRASPEYPLSNLPGDDPRLYRPSSYIPCHFFRASTPASDSMTDGKVPSSFRLLIFGRTEHISRKVTKELTIQLKTVN